VEFFRASVPSGSTQPRLASGSRRHLLWFVLVIVINPLLSAIASPLLLAAALILLGSLTSSWVGANVSAICLEDYRPSVADSSSADGQAS
jgi:hypothetical protein